MCGLNWKDSFPGLVPSPGYRTAAIKIVVVVVEKRPAQTADGVVGVPVEVLVSKEGGLFFPGLCHH